MYICRYIDTVCTQNVQQELANIPSYKETTRRENNLNGYDSRVQTQNNLILRSLALACSLIWFSSFVLEHGLLQTKAFITCGSGAKIFLILHAHNQDYPATNVCLFLCISLGDIFLFTFISTFHPTLPSMQMLIHQLHPQGFYYN